MLEILCTIETLIKNSNEEKIESRTRYYYLPNRMRFCVDDDVNGYTI